MTREHPRRWKAVLRACCAASLSAAMAMTAGAQEAPTRGAAAIAGDLGRPGANGAPPAPASTPASASASSAAPRDGAPGTRGEAPRRQSRAAAQGVGIDIRLPNDDRGAPDMALAVRIVLGLTLLAVLPALLVCMTAFLRIIVVLSMLRFAIGMAETPPNTVLIGLALFLTLFTMQPVLQALNQEALQPFMQGALDGPAAYEKAAMPLREFMVRQTRQQDLALVIDLAKAPRPGGMDDIGNLQLIPAFMLSELRAAFQIGFVIFLPFLLIDLIVSSILMALGMMMMPPVTVALPIKVLMFILVDGWSLVLKALVGSFR